MYICMSGISSNFSTFLLSQLVLFKCLEWIKHPTKQGSHVDHYERMKFSSIDFCYPKRMNWNDSYAVFKTGNGIRKPGSALFLPFSFFFSLIFIIVITFKQFTWNGHGNEINSCHPLFLLPKRCCTINKFAQENERTDSWGFTQWYLGEWEGDERGIDILV